MRKDNRQIAKQFVDLRKNLKFSLQHTERTAGIPKRTLIFSEKKQDYTPSEKTVKKMSLFICRYQK